MHYLTLFANTAPAEQDLFASLGVDWKLLLLQTLAFLILLWFLKKFVYPPLIKMLDAHEKRINEAREAANVAKREAESTQAEVAALLTDARKEASAIVTTAKDEATALSEAADKKSKERAERLVETAREDIQKEVIAAKKALRGETIDLVAAATEKVVGANLKDVTDKQTIATALEEASK